MDSKQRDIWGHAIKILFALIIAAGMIIAAHTFSGTVAGRPVIGSFSGSLSQSSTSEIMDLPALRYYLSLYPSESYGEYGGDGSSYMDYDAENAKMLDDLQRDIVSGKWPDFPYVQLGERMYFSKQAVDDWFYAQAKVQLQLQ